MWNVTHKSRRRRNRARARDARRSLTRASRRENLRERRALCLAARTSSSTHRDDDKRRRRTRFLFAREIACAPLSRARARARAAHLRCRFTRSKTGASIARRRALANGTPRCARARTSTSKSFLRATYASSRQRASALVRARAGDVRKPLSAAVACGAQRFLSASLSRAPARISVRFVCSRASARLPAARRLPSPRLRNGGDATSPTTRERERATTSVSARGRCASRRERRKKRKLRARARAREQSANEHKGSVLRAPSTATTAATNKIGVTSDSRGSRAHAI